MKRGGGVIQEKQLLLYLVHGHIYQYSEQLCSTCDMNSHCSALTSTFIKGDCLTTRLGFLLQRLQLKLVHPKCPLPHVMEQQH